MALWCSEHQRSAGNLCQQPQKVHYNTKLTCLLRSRVHNQTVRLVGIHPKEVHAPKTAAHKNHPKNIVSEEKHVHRIVLALPKPNIAFKTTK